MYSWGAGTKGQLGTGQLEDAVTPKPVVWDQETPHAVACGGNHVVALTSKAAWFWGLARSVGVADVLEASNASDTVAQARQIPPALFAGTRVSCVSAGWSHTAFVTGDGCLWTAGGGAFGQLGAGTSVTHAAKPVQLKGILACYQVSQVACGMHHTLALAWPRSQAAKPANSVPTLQMQDEGVLAATPGRYPQSFVFGFGANRKGQCAVRHQAQQGTVAGNLWEPSVVSGISAGQQIVEVIAGGDHSGALDQEGCVHLWGRTFTPLPQPPPTIQPPKTCQLPFAVQTQSHTATLTTAQLSSCRWKQVSLGWSHALGLDREGNLWAWGSNRYGQCAQPPDTHQLLPQPTLVSRICSDAQFTCISAGSEHSAAVSAAGNVCIWGWGEHGQLGVETLIDVWQPTRVDLPACVTVACGSGFTFAVQA